jgi:hypothetical protein
LKGKSFNILAFFSLFNIEVFLGVLSIYGCSPDTDIQQMARCVAYNFSLNCYKNNNISFKITGCFI